MGALISSMKVLLTTWLICAVGYAGIVLGMGLMVAREASEGSLIRRPDGTVIGSRLIAQSFDGPGYFWPRPSATSYRGVGAGGSNLSPTNDALRQRGTEAVARHQATALRPLPADLAAASGSGLDPDISLAAAEFQIDRVAKARGMSVESVRAIVRRIARSTGAPIVNDRLVNVLELNLALDSDISAEPRGATTLRPVTADQGIGIEQ